MEIYDIENRQYEELRQRYFQLNGKYFCLLCDFCCVDRSQMMHHQAQVHSREDAEDLFLKL